LLAVVNSQISPNPSLPKRGNERGALPKRGDKREALPKRGNKGEGRVLEFLNKDLDYG